jgi:hypothetical protein
MQEIYESIAVLGADGCHFTIYERGTTPTYRCQPRQAESGRDYMLKSIRGALACGARRLWLHADVLPGLGLDPAGDATPALAQLAGGKTAPGALGMVYAGDLTIIVPAWRASRDFWYRLTTPLSLLRGLTLTQTCLRWPVQGTGMTVGHNLLTALHQQPGSVALRPALVASQDIPEPMTMRRRGTIETACQWDRPLLPAERAMPWVHAFDKRKAYLGAMGQVLLGNGPATYKERPTFDKRLPGYWRGQVTLPSPVTGLPPVVSPDPFLWERTRWYTTPTIAYALESGATFTPEGAWLWDTGHRLLVSFVDRLRETFTRLAHISTTDRDAQETAEDFLKQVYCETYGGFCAERLYARQAAQYTETLLQPYWMHAVIAQLRTTVQRQVASVARATGRVPIAIATDALYFVSDAANPLDDIPDGLRLDDALGAYRPKESLPLADFLEQRHARLLLDEAEKEEQYATP